jgi:short-subunit dehydrogenase
MAPGSVVITGASRGIGAAVARRLAAPGMHMLLIARDAERLTDTAAACAAAGAVVRRAGVDVADGPALTALLADQDGAYPIDFLFANAGISTGHHGGRLEPAERAAAVIRVNLEGTVNTVGPLAEPMAARGRGHIALVASIAGLVPLPDTPAYCASKAGMIAYGLALDATLRPRGVSLTVLCPGFIETEMAGRYSGNKPFQMSAERAAGLMVAATLKGRRLYAFPWQLAWLARGAARLPPAVRARAMGGYRTTIKPEPDR